MATTSKPILAALFTPPAVDGFLNDHWPRRPFVAHGNPARFPPVLRAAELSSVQALAQCYRGTMAFTHGRTTDKMVEIKRVDPAILCEMGLTLAFDDVGPYVPGAMEFLHGLELELGLNENTLMMSAFASPNQDGLGCHYDAQDIISIQLHGTKTFRYAPVREITMPYGAQYTPRSRPYDELYPQVPNGFPDERDVEFETAEMKPGTVLFLPRATWHQTQADGPSLSLSIIIKPPTLLDCALEQLRWLFLQDSAWREPLYGATAAGPMHQRLHAHAARLLERLPALVSCLSPDDLIAAPLPVGKRLDQICDTTRFQRIPDARLEIAASASRGASVLSIWLGQTESRTRISARLEIPTVHVPVFQWIDSRGTLFTGAEVKAAFPNMSSEERQKILATLTRAEFIKMLWFPHLAPEARVGDTGRP